MNMFLQKAGVWNCPIQIHLRPATYHKYRQFWQRLVCFAYRSTHPQQAVRVRLRLRHQLNTAQLAALDQMEDHGTQLLTLQQQRRETDPAETQFLQNQLDQACLAFCIALLDHSLKGNLFDSTLVGFLAILGVGVQRQTFRDPASYTTYLSTLAKMAQLLVAKRCVQMADGGQVDHPADALEEMRVLFLMYRVRAPFGWITPLRTYGKKIQNTTTSLGYIYWSDDKQTLSYKVLELTMARLREFVHTEVEMAQADWEELLLHEEEIREEVVPPLELHKLHDNPTRNQQGWNFLRNPATGPRSPRRPTPPGAVAVAG